MSRVLDAVESLLAELPAVSPRFLDTLSAVSALNRVVESPVPLLEGTPVMPGVDAVTDPYFLTTTEAVTEVLARIVREGPAGFPDVTDASVAAHVEALVEGDLTLPDGQDRAMRLVVEVAVRTVGTLSEVLHGATPAAPVVVLL